MEVGKSLGKESAETTLSGSLYDIFRSNVERNSSYPVVIFHGKHASYYNTLPLVDSLAESLRNKFSVDKGERVGLALPLSPQFFIAFLALQKIGAVAAPLDPEITAFELENINGLLGLRAIFCGSTASISVGEESSIETVISTRIQDFLPFEKAVATTAKLLGKAGPKISGKKNLVMFSDLLYDVPGEEVDTDPENDAAAVLVSPSRGGDLQAMVFTTSNLISSASAISRTVPPFKGRFKMGTVMPPFLPYSFMFSVVLPIFLGGTTITPLGRYNYYKLFSMCSLHSCDYMLASPYDLNRMLERGMPNLAVKDLRGILCSSYLLSDKVREKFEKQGGIRVIEYYGVPEMIGISHLQSPDPSRRKAGSPGYPLPGIEAKIVDEATHEEIQQGSKGELLIMGPQLARELIPAPGEGSPYYYGGMFDSGDLAKIDEDGLYFIEDRRREAIVSRGILVSSREIESVIASVEGISEVAVVGIDNNRGEEEIIAVVSAEKETGGLSARITEECRKLLSSYKVPARLEFRKELPKSLSGKILKRQIIEEHKTDNR